MWKRIDFFPSGSTEIAPIFIIPGIKGAARSINDRALLIIRDGFGWTFKAKEGTFKAKENWLKIKNSSLIQKKYEKWLRKWLAMDNKFYVSASQKKQAWRKTWKKTDTLNEQFWAESYLIETLDSFAGEIDETIIAAFKKVGIPLENKFSLLSPAKPNLIQRIFVDREKVRRGNLSRKEYLRQYWFSHATWNGGKILDQKTLEKDLQEKEQFADFNKIKIVHHKFERKLDKKTRTLIEILRILSIWREERKAIMQRIILVYENIARQAASELGCRVEAVKGAFSSEIRNIPKDPKLFAERLNNSVFLFEKGGQKVKALSDSEIEKYQKEFLESESRDILKGTPASPGKAVGKVHIILKKKDFGKFKRGEILVTTMTRPEFLPLMKKAKALITEEGGLTAHAAIASREMHIPCIVGVQGATSALKDGDRIKIDANRGIIEKIE